MVARVSLALIRLSDERSIQVALKDVALPGIARLAKGLKVLINRVAASAPWSDVDNVKCDARRQRAARPTSAA